MKNSSRITGAAENSCRILAIILTSTEALEYVKKRWNDDEALLYHGTCLFDSTMILTNRPKESKEEREARKAKQRDEKEKRRQAKEAERDRKKAERNRKMEEKDNNFARNSECKR